MTTQRKSRLDPFLDRIGVMPDREVAELAGVTTENVRAWRKRRGVPARWREEAEAPPPEPPPTRSARRAAPDRPLASAAWLVTVERDGAAEECVVLAPDAAEAAARAMARVGLGPGGCGDATILSVSFLSDALLA